jgi:hypothetical protein
MGILDKELNAQPGLAAGEIPMITENCSYPHLFAEGINSTKFAEMVSQAIQKTLRRLHSDFPREAIDQWETMGQSEKLTFVYGCLECFYWVYISRNKEAYPFWENASIIQKVERAAGFCLFILGTEFEESYLGEFPETKLPSTEWIN